MKEEPDRGEGVLAAYLVLNLIFDRDIELALKVTRPVISLGDNACPEVARRTYGPGPG